MTKRINFLLIVVLFSSLAVPSRTVAQVVIGSPMYTAPSFGGSVVDEETQQPLEGVIVVAHWELQRTAIETLTVGQLKVLETLTDARGHYQFPAWTQAASPLDHVSPDSPDLLFFKPGYSPFTTSNFNMRDAAAGPILRSDLDGKIIQLKKFVGSLKQYAEDSGKLDDTLDAALFRPSGNCEWKYIPYMLVALHRENKRLKEQGLRLSSDYPASIEDRDSSYKISLAKCGSIQTFLRSYLP